MNPTPAMIVHRSNRTEALLDALVAVVATPPDDPFAAETIVVQGAGMARWLSLTLARRLGIWANPAFPFPRKLVDDAAAAVLGPPPDGAAAFSADALLWAVAAELPQHLDTAPFAPLHSYLAGDSAGRKRLQLARRIADLFDQYALFRPEMLLGWQAGRADGATDEPWQPVLWRGLVARLGPAHPAARARDLLHALAEGGVPAAPFPRRVSVFGLSTLAPLYVRIFAALAAAVDVHLFVLSPTEHYWGDLQSPRRAARMQARLGGAAVVVNGHPLLASLGAVGRDFADGLEEAGDYEAHDAYRAPEGGSVLATLQADMLAMRARGSTPDTEPPLALPPGDDSVALHACHGPMREVEVVHDQLTALFEADPSLHPHDVVVMAPSIETYAPLIDAVFGSPSRPRIPFRTADRAARADAEVLDALLRAIDVVGGRFGASAVLDLLGLDPVRMRTGIAAEEMETLHRWVRDANIRWGANAAHRRAEGQPDCDLNTWRFGLDRLLLGYALPPEGDALFGAVRPIDGIEGGEAAVLGRLAAFVATLTSQRETLSASRPPGAWHEALTALLALLVERSAANAPQHEAIATALTSLAERAAVAGFVERVDLDTMRHLLEQALDQAGPPRGFGAGAVTLCELVPMRSIPFRVVCLIGLNDGAFPRTRRPLSFDLVAATPRRGDRSPREDDRYLFLEALLSARERMLITYVGQRISDNVAVPPSVVVSELCDAIDQTFRSDDDRTPSERLTVRHPLQPFSHRYFDGSPSLFSFSERHCAGARALQMPRATAPSFFTGPLDAGELETVDLDDLVRFFDNPSRAFLRSLGLYLDDDRDPHDDREPIVLNQLERWGLGDELMTSAAAGGDPAATRRRLIAEGRLPLGTPGVVLLDAIAPLATDIGAQARAARGPAPSCRDIDLTIDGVRLVGSLSGIGPEGLVGVQFSKLGGRHELRFWIRHLALAASGASGTSSLFGRHASKPQAAAIRFTAVNDPLRHLAALLAPFRDGRARPLAFFERASREYAARIAKRKGPDAAIAEAAKKFASGDFAAGDADDPSVAQLYPNGAPFAAAGPQRDAFAAVALAVYGPLLDHLGKEGAP